MLSPVPSHPPLLRTVAPKRKLFLRRNFLVVFWEIPPPGQNGYCREDPNDNGGASIVCLHNKIIILAGNRNGERARKWLRTQ